MPHLMGAWNVGTDRYHDIQRLALWDIYELNQSKQDFSLCLLFVICGKNYGKQISIGHQLNTSKVNPPPSPLLPPTLALTTNLNNKLLQSMPT